MNKKICSIILLFNFLFLSGCATTTTHVPLTKQNKQSIKTVYVRPEIKKPDEMYMFASGSQWGMAFGLIGGIVSGAINQNSATSMSKFADKNQIDIRKIVYQQWMNQKNSMFKFDNKATDVELITNIDVYGLSIPHGLTTDYVPVLTLNAKLVRKNEIIWQDSEHVIASTEALPRYKMDQIMSDPKKLYSMWEKASEKVIGALLKDMNKEA